MPFKIKKTVSNITIIGNSVYFNGASQYLSTPTSTNFDPGTNTAWTLEFWGYPINGCIVTLATGVSWGNSLWLSWGSSQFTWIQGNSAGSNPVNLTTAASYPANNWYHIVVCKDSANTSRMFINGTQVLSSTYNSSLGSPNRLLVNSAWDNNGFYGGGNGYVSNVRWIKGTALYTASFTVPTSPLTAIANTQLLTCNAATIIDGSTNNFTITNNGGATVSSAVTPFGSTFLPFKIKKNNVNLTSGFKLKHVSYVRPNYMIATGGDLITTSGSYKIHTFTTVGTSSFVVSNLGESPSIEYLVIGGGGGGGAGRNCGGGGAGGLIYNTASLSVGTYTIIVGQSGSAAIATNPAAANGGNGGNSIFNALVALGGGGGSGGSYANNGGSGGGGFLNPTNGIGLQPTSSYGGFGNNGGSGYNIGGGYGAGGGGGAGAVGADGTSSTGGNGGNGKAYAFVGASTYYAGGGGGSVNPGTPGIGGLGGGGAGINTNFGTPVNATGYGSGGGGGLNANGGAGSPGIILIKYRYTT